MGVNANDVVQFKYNGRVYFALIYGVSKEGKILCYRVVEKTKVSKKYIPVSNKDGLRTEFQVQYGCRFILPEECRVKIICHCEDGFTKVVADEYNKLPLLSSLKEERDQLQKEMKQLSQKDKKRIVSRYNELNQIINDRSTTFLMEGAKSKVRNKYSNFRTVPDKNGIRKVCSGGKVSPK